MLDKFSLTKKDIGKYKISPKNPLSLTCEKVTQTPRVFNTSQIKSAIENISFINIEENIIPKNLTKIIEYILKDFFLYMHQTGLYNRQFKFWKTLGSITQCKISKLQKGFFKKKDLNIQIIEFYIDPKVPCIKSLIIERNNNEQNFGFKNTYREFKYYLSKTLADTNINRLKGIICFLNYNPDETFISKLNLITNAVDPISKYESVLLDLKDVRLNVITCREENEQTNFYHVFPELKSLKNNKELRLSK